MANLAESDPTIYGEDRIVVDTDLITTDCYVIRNFVPKDITKEDEEEDDKGNVVVAIYSGQAMEATAKLIVKNAGTCRAACKGDLLLIDHPTLTELTWRVVDAAYEDAGAKGIMQTVTLRHSPQLDTATVTNAYPAQASV